MKRHITFFAIAIAIGLAAIAANAQVLGGYKAISSDDAEAAEAAEFAVSTKAEEQEGLSLSSGYKAERQSASGTNFRLCIEVELEGESQFVSTVVHRDTHGDFSLKSWTVVDGCGGGGGERAYKSRKAARCTGSQLRLVESDADADMGGKRYQRYMFINTSRRSCTLKGFPTVTALNRSGRALKVSVDYSDSYPGGAGDDRPSSVTLRPNGRANFQVYYSDGMALDHPKITNIAKFRVTATADKKAFTVAAGFGVCCSSITVGSIQGGGPGE